MLILRIGSGKHTLEWKAYVCHGDTNFLCSMNYIILWIKNWKLDDSLDKLPSSKSGRKTPGKELGQGELYTDTDIHLSCVSIDKLFNILLLLSILSSWGDNL